MGQSTSQSSYMLCLWDSSGESTDNECTKVKAFDSRARNEIALAVDSS